MRERELCMANLSEKIKAMFAAELRCILTREERDNSGSRQQLAGDSVNGGTNQRQYSRQWQKSERWSVVLIRVELLGTQQRAGKYQIEVGMTV